MSRQAAGEEQDRAELAEGAGEGERDAGGEAGEEVGEDDAAEDREAAGAERGRRLLHLAVHLDQQRLHRADDEGQGDEEQGDDDRGAGEGDVDAERAVVAVEGEQGEAGDDRRQREGQVDDRVDDGLAGELVADQDPGDDRAEDRVDRRRRSARQITVSSSERDRLRRGDLVPEVCRGRRSSDFVDDSAASGSRTIRLR